MSGWPILSLITFIPLVGAGLLMLMKSDSAEGRQNVLYISLATTIVAFVLSLFMWYGFDNSNAGFQFVEKVGWLNTGISYHVGVDGISMLFVVLSAFLMPFCVLASWISI